MGALEALVLTVALSAGPDTVLLDFYSESCPPCLRMAPVVQQLEAKGYAIRRVNVDREPALAARFGVSRIPCFVALVDGREAHRVVGEISLAQLELMCQLGRRKEAPGGVPIHLVGSDRAGPASVMIPAVQSSQPFAASGTSRAPSTMGKDSRASASVPGWRLTSPDWAGPASGQEPSYDHLVAATVRLRIGDARGHNAGSGTIIDARQGHALILTCGHIFRDSQGKGTIEVDLFGPTPAERIPGRLVDYDLARDLGLLAIRVPGPVAVARVAPPGHPMAKGARVISLGCDHGEAPSASPCIVTSQDRFLGPPNLVATGLPVHGRSGGGLFSSDGLLIGVCNAAVPPDNEGLYAALGAIHAELDQLRMSYVYRSDEGKSSGALAAATPEPPAMPRQMPPPSDLVNWTEAPGRPAGSEAPQARAAPAQLSENEMAALEEIRRRVDEGAEVVCIIRSRTDPTAPSEVVVLERASSGFVRELMAGVGARGNLSPRSAGATPSGLPAPPPTSPTPRPPVQSTRSDTIPVTHTLPPAPEMHADGGNWYPRWLQPGYAGS
jgi:thiol-disulfide isomerase/thioredoxin